MSKRRSRKHHLQKVNSLLKIREEAGHDQQTEETVSKDPRGLIVIIGTIPETERKSVDISETEVVKGREIVATVKKS